MNASAAISWSHSLCNNTRLWLWVPAFARTTAVVAVTLPLPPGRAAPVLQRRPHAARKAEAVDRGRRAQRLEAMQLDAAPLKTAFLQDVARRRIGDARAREQLLEVELLEIEIDRGARGLGAKALAPMLDAQPVAEFRRLRLLPVDADHADRCVIVLDQEHGLAGLG